MKKIIVKLIEWYQRIPFSTHHLCRFYPTCSEYTKQCVIKFGALKGALLGIKRILKCNPLFKGGIDLVPMEEKWKK